MIWYSTAGHIKAVSDDKTVVYNCTCIRGNLHLLIKHVFYAQNIPRSVMGVYKAHR